MVKAVEEVKDEKDYDLGLLCLKCGGHVPFQHSDLPKPGEGTVMGVWHDECAPQWQPLVTS